MHRFYVKGLNEVMAQNIFTAYKYDGTVWASGTDGINPIRNVGITLNVPCGR